VESSIIVAICFKMTAAGYLKMTVVGYFITINSLILIYIIELEH